MTTVFLSYARGDDGEPYSPVTSFAARLHRDLTAAGFDVWFDQVTMPSRSLTFHQEIKDAIRQGDRIVYIAGPKAALSSYVREEWQFALECDKTVIPILRKGDVSNVPAELRDFQCDDFRDDKQYPARLARLIANLNREPPTLGYLFGVPNLPPHFQQRPDILLRLKNALRVDLQRPVVVSSATSRVGVQGMGGIGKSVLAAAVARDREIRRSYPDGVIWVSFGQVKPDPRERDIVVSQLMRDVAKHLGNPGLFENIAQGQGILRELLLTKAVLLVLDDVWHAADVQPFDVLGSRCRALITTRDAGIIRTLNGELYPVELFTEAEALSLLASAVDWTPEQLPTEAREVVKECDGLALAVALCAGMAKSGRREWSSILHRLRNADLERIEDRQAIEPTHRSIYRAIQVSVEALEPQEQQRFAELSVFVTDQDVPEAAVATLWAHTGDLSELDTEDLLISLSERALIGLARKEPNDGRPSARHISLHDLLYDFAKRAAGDQQALNRALLDGYQKQCTDGWHTGPNDGYFLRNLCQHLATATGNWDETVEVLCDLRFVEARCRVGEVFELRADYHVAINALPEAQEGLKVRREQEALAATWTSELTRFARTWTDRHDRAAQGLPVEKDEPRLPKAPTACRTWTGEEIANEAKRIMAHPTRLDHLTAFHGFLASGSYSLLEFGRREGFVAQHAWNREPAGLIHDAGAALLAMRVASVLLRHWPPDAVHISKPALLGVLEGSGDAKRGVTVSSDGRRAIAGGSANSLSVWDVESGICLATLSGHTSAVTSVCAPPDGRLAVSGSDDSTVRVWDLEHRTCVHTLKGHRDSVLSVAITPDGSRAVSASQDHSLRVWDLRTGRCVRILQSPLNRERSMDGMMFGITSVSITPDGRRAVSGSDQNTLSLWDLESGKCLRTLEGHTDMVLSVAVTPDGRRAVSGGLDDTLRIWDLSTGACTHTFPGHNGGVWTVDLTPDGQYAISGSGDRTIEVWHLDRAVSVRKLRTDGGVSSVRITPDGRRAISASWGGGNLLCWDLASGESPFTPEGRNFTAIGIGRHGRRAVLVSNDSIRIADLDGNTCLHTLDCTELHCLCVTNDGRYVLLGDVDNTIHVWEVESGTCIRQMGDVSEDDYVTCLNVSVDGKWAISGHLSGVINVWSIDNGECLLTLAADSDIQAVCLTPDGLAAVWASIATIGVVGIEGDNCLRVIHADEDENDYSGFESLDLTASGRTIISGHSNGALRVWDFESGSCVRELTGHTQGVHTVSVTSGGYHAVSGSYDGTLRIWDLESGTCLAVHTIAALVQGCGFVGPGNQVCAGTHTGEVHLLDLDGIELN